METMRRVNTTMPESLLRKVDLYSQLNLEDRATAIRQLVAEGLCVKLRQGAELLEITYLEMNQLLRDHHIPVARDARAVWRRKFAAESAEDLVPPRRISLVRSSSCAGRPHRQCDRPASVRGARWPRFQEKAMHQAFITGILLLAVSASAADLRVGRAAVEIPPFKGDAARGSYVGGAGGVHDPAHAKALVLESSGVWAAMVVCDVIGVPRDVVEEARKIIENDTGIPGDRVMISATHTHTGPSIRGAAGRAAVPALIAQSVKLAAADRKPAQAAAGIGREESLVFNRRFLMKDGTVRFNPGKLNPDIMRPVGPVDPTVAVVSFESVEGRPLSTYVNYPMHLDTVGGDQVSADYPHTLSTLLEKTKGEGMLTVFSMGTSGNVNHLDVKIPDRQKGHGEAARIGTVLAGEVLKTYTRMETVAAGALDVRSRIVKLPLLELKPGEVEKAKATIEKARLENRELSFLERVYTGKVLRVAARQGQPIDAEVQVIALGRQVAWVGLPGEIFVELGMAIKAMSPFPYTIVVSLASDSLGYVPDRRAYVQGAYEVLNSRLAAGGGELMVDAAVEMLRELWGRQHAAGLSGENKRLGFQPLFKRTSRAGKPPRTTGRSATA
jgi:neutral ceramidase